MEREYSAHVKVAGVNIMFDSDLEADICDLRILFKHHLADATDGQEQHRVDIRTVKDISIPKDAKLVWKGYYHGIGQKHNPDNDVKKYLSADGRCEYFVTNNDACIVNELGASHTTCKLLNRRLAFQTKWVRANIGSIIMLLTHIVMAYNRRYTLHASAVVWRERAVVFVGRSGQGKSTLSTDLVTQGAGFLGDDIVFAYLDDDRRPRIGSLLFDAKLYESSRKNKDFIDILERYHCERIESAPLQAIADVHQTRQGESVVEKTGDPDLMLSTFLTAANNIALQYDYDDWMTLCASIMENFQLYTFHFGDRGLLKKEVLDAFYEQG